MQSPKSSAIIPVSSLDHVYSSPLRVREDLLYEEQRHRGSIGKEVRNLGVVSLAFIAYLAIAGGPFGIEDSVNAGGVFGAILGIVLLPIVWGVPQAFMTAELSSMMDENGGYILWVYRGMGPLAGWLNAFNSIASNILDIPTYPVLFSSYVVAYCNETGTELTSLQVYLVKLFALVLVVAANLIGLRLVAIASVLMALFVIAPFVVEPLFVARATTSGLLSVAKPFQLGVFTSNMLWNYQGWDGLGCLAGEVADGGRTYPLAVLLALLLITLNYLVPVITGALVVPDYHDWTEGTLEIVALRISHFLGLWVGMAAAISTLGEFTVNMAMQSRALWAVSKCKMLPHWLSKEWGAFGTPAAAILVQGTIAALLMNFEFDDLVSGDVFFTCVSLILEMVSFLRLRYVEPDTERPFKIPGGLPVAWALSILKIGLLLLVMCSSGFNTWMLGIFLNFMILVGYFFWRKYEEAAGLDFSTYQPIPSD